MPTKKPCIVCGALSSGTRCPTHRQAKERARQAGRDPQRYAQNQALRKVWAPRVATGEVRCRRCRKPIRVGTEWHIGHPDAECVAPVGPEHATCNTSAAGRLSHG